MHPFRKQLAYFGDGDDVNLNPDVIYFCFLQIEGVALESPRSGKVIEFTASTDKCPLCPERLGMHIDYTVGCSILNCLIIHWLFFLTVKPLI